MLTSCPGRMMRHMVGALLAVGEGKLPPDHITHLLAIGSSQRPGMPDCI